MKQILIVEDDSFLNKMLAYRRNTRIILYFLSLPVAVSTPVFRACFCGSYSSNSVSKTHFSEAVCSRAY